VWEKWWRKPHILNPSTPSQVQLQAGERLLGVDAKALGSEITSQISPAEGLVHSSVGQVRSKP